MSTTVAQLSADSKIALSLKKLQGKAHTKNDNELYNEGLPSGITMDSTTIFGARPPKNPSTVLGAISGECVEKVRLVVEFIPGSDSILGRHGFKLKLPSDYEVTSQNPKKGVAPFINGQVVVDTGGALQLVPPQYHYLYEAKPYYGTTGNLTQIPLTDPRDWNLDYFNGVIFQQDPYGPGDHFQNPTYIDAFIYIGDFLDTVVGSGGGGGGSQVQASYLVLNANADLTHERILSVDSGLTKTDQGAGGNLVLGIDDSVVATISGSTFTGDISAPNITGTQSITSPLFHGANLFLDDGTTESWIAGNNVEIVIDPITGQRTINTLGGDSAFIVTSPGYLNTTSSVSFGGDLGSDYETTDVGSDVYFFVSGSQDQKSVFGGDVVISGSLNVENGTNIGPVSYTDGYFTSFENTTLVGLALSQINDLLKQLAPPEAPYLSSINEAFKDGKTARLSFGTSLPLVNYSNHSTAGGFSISLDVNNLYQKEISENTSYRIGVLGVGTNEIGGSLANNVVKFVHPNGVVNYPDRSFGNANDGTLTIELNGNVLHSISLLDPSIGVGIPGAGTGIYTNVNGSGFLSLSAVGYGKFQSGQNVLIDTFRTGEWRINRTDWRRGYNFARVTHNDGVSNHVTGFQEWIYDDDTSLITVSNAQLLSQAYTDEVQISGIKYFSSGSIEYACRVLNMYKNVYPSESNAVGFSIGESTIEGIEINGIFSSVQSVGVPVIDEGAETVDKILDITGSINLAPSHWLLNDVEGFGINLSHPLKVDIVNGEEQFTEGILMFQDISESTFTLEDFHNETYRVNPAIYNSQSEISSESFDSSIDRSSGEHLIVQAGKLLSPLASINGGNFRNTADGGIIPNGPNDNVDYSTVTGELTFYRKFKNNTGSTMFSLLLDIEGEATIVGDEQVLSGDNFKMYMKLPLGSKTLGQTGWCDLTKDFYTGQYSDGDGLLRNKLDAIMPMENTYTFGTNGVGIDDWVIIKIVADASWTGYLSSISITWDTKRYVINN